MKNHTLVGVLSAREGLWNIITSDDAPDHLKVLYLRDSQIGHAQLGDRVELQYVSTPRFGLWSVSKVLKVENPLDTMA